MSAAIPHTYDDRADNVFDTGDPRSFLDDLVVAERAGTATFEELVSPLNAMWCIGSALLGIARRAVFGHVGANLETSLSLTEDSPRLRPRAA